MSSGVKRMIIFGAVVAQLAIGIALISVVPHGFKPVLAFGVPILLFAEVIVLMGAQSNTGYGTKAKQMFTAWDAANPRQFQWTEMPVDGPDSRALANRFGGEPPFNSDGQNPAMHVTAHWAVTADGLNAHLLELSDYNGVGPVHTEVTAASIDIPWTGPRLSVYPRTGIRQRRWASVGNIRTGDAAFDKLCYVATSHASVARAALTPQVTGFLAADPRAPHVGITLERGTLNVWLRSDHARDASAALVDLVVELYRRMPVQAWSR